MQSLVVLFALASVACGSYIPLAQPAHHPAIVLDPHGRPLDTAEVIHARAAHLQAKALEPHAAVAVAPVAVAHSVVAPAYVAAPAAVSHQSRVDVRTSPAVYAHAAPLSVAAHGAYAAPLLGHSALGYAGHGHYLGKRSLGHIAYSAPIAVRAYHAAPAAVSHQSRVDVVSSPAYVSHSYAAPVFAHAAPVAIAPSAVSHQSRVDVRTSPAVVSTVVAAPVAHSAVYAAPLAHSAVYAAPLAHGAGHYAHGW
ncbi:larval/pupal cuticle protein H1C-like isoform X2 [Pieris napi]|uniref:larval/pupal cuticle protein H1C-like isoform X2 n=1 Tax=Pieris napi TaxID=78633 RepID=UPI001FB8ECAF|nr:larval/pupal cuticle protein H1C-like isoform X2 [Pieris napi]